MTHGDDTIHERHLTVVHLAVHLENKQRVYFTADNVRARALVPPATTLTAFYSLCPDDLFAKTLLYSEVPEFMHRLKSFNVSNRVKQLKDLPICIPTTHWVVCTLFTRTIQNASICDCC